MPHNPIPDSMPQLAALLAVSLAIGASAIGCAQPAVQSAPPNGNAGNSTAEPTGGGSARSPSPAELRAVIAPKQPLFAIIRVNNANHPYQACTVLYADGSASSYDSRRDGDAQSPLAGAEPPDSPKGMAALADKMIEQQVREPSAAAADEICRIWEQACEIDFAAGYAEEKMGHDRGESTTYLIGADGTPHILSQTGDTGKSPSDGRANPVAAQVGELSRRLASS